jgi:DNA-binding transcriptional ArsR family regulator
MSRITRIFGIMVVFCLITTAMPVSAQAAPGIASCTRTADCSGSPSGILAGCMTCPLTGPANGAKQPDHPNTNARTCPTGLPLQTFQVTTRAPARVSGLRRIYKNNVLEQEDRACVYCVICQKPGIDLTTIAGTIGLNPHTLRYHLDMMESNGKVIAMREQGITRYYENHGRYSALERKLMSYMWNPRSERLLRIIKSHPDTSQSGIALRLGITVPTLRWYARRLTSDGIVTIHQSGRYIQYQLTEEADRILSGKLVAGAPVIWKTIFQPIPCNKEEST